MRETTSAGERVSAASNKTTDGRRPDSSDIDTDDDDDAHFALVIDLDADADSKPAGTPPKMTAVQHQSSVDRGLKMKIKRKNVNNSAPPAVKTDSKHDAKGEAKCPQGGAVSTAKQGEAKCAKARPASQKRTKSEKQRPTEVAVSTAALTLVSTTMTTSTVTSTAVVTTDADCAATSADTVKRECSSNSDPYEFNAKVEDRIGLPMKKIKTEKGEIVMTTTTATVSTATSPISSVFPNCSSTATETCSIGVATDPDCLGPCEPGTHVMLEGIVWNETDNGVLVVNVTWRGKTYVGTLMDSTKHNWAPPRFNCDSPTSDLEPRTPKGRGKRGRGAAIPNPAPPEVGDRKLRKSRRNGAAVGAPTTAPSSPDVRGSGKRKGRPTELDLATSAEKSCKRIRCSSRNAPPAAPPSEMSVELIECPEPNCNKKYRHINGLRYHQTHVHQCASSRTESGSQSDADSTADRNTEQTDEQTDETVTDKPTDDDDADKTDVKCEPVVATDEVATPPQVTLPSSVLPSVVITMPTPSPQTDTADKARRSSSNKQKKVCSTTRPVVAVSKPPPLLTVAATASTTATTTTNSLKPIQPKPTILGVNMPTASLNSLKDLKEKKAKKKKRDKTKTGDVTPAPPTTAVSIATGATSVIQASPLRTANPTTTAVAITNTSGNDSTKTAPPELLKQPSPAPPSELAVNSPLCVLTETQDSVVAGGSGSNVQSPAYSDISDANDSAPTLENEVEAEPSDVAPAGGHTAVPASSASYAMPFYGQPPYLVPAVSRSDDTSNRLTPDVSERQLERQSERPADGESKATAESEVRRNTDESRQDKINQKIRQQQQQQQQIKQPQQQQQPQKQQQQHQQQQQQQQHMYHGHPAYQQYQKYVNAYGAYPVDSNYHMKMMANSASGFTRVSTPDKTAAADGKPVEKEPSELKSMEKPIEKPPIVPSPPVVPVSASRVRCQSDKPNDSVELSLDEKRNENHQIMKENIQLKSQMDKRMYDSSNPQWMGYEPTSLADRQRQELHYHMVQQQQQQQQQQRLREQKYLGTPPGAGTPHKMTASTVVVPAPEKGPKDLSTKSGRKREGSADRGASRPSSRDNKETERSVISPSGKDPHAVALAYPPGFYPYMQPQHYAAHMQFDPAMAAAAAQGLYPPMFSYPAGGNPAQYHIANLRGYTAGTTPDKMMMSPGSGAGRTAKDIDMIAAPSAPYYMGRTPSAAQHKIHELKTAAKIAPSTATLSPPPATTPGKDVVERASPVAAGSSNKCESPPLQRHLHTHHHTHVVGPGYRMYSHYPAGVAPAKSVPTPDSPARHPFVAP